MTTTAIALLALSLGVCIGYILCAVMMLSGEEQRRAELRAIPDGAPLEPESQP